MIAFMVLFYILENIFVYMSLFANLIVYNVIVHVTGLYSTDVNAWSCICMLI